jgi:hypothetical protein
MELAGCLSGAQQAAEEATYSTHCAAMAESEEPAPAMTGTNSLPCCEWAAAPAPDAKEAGGKANFSPAPTTLAERIENPRDAAFPGHATVAEYSFDASPPDRQPLLCTFLI